MPWLQASRGNLLVSPGHQCPGAQGDGLLDSEAWPSEPQVDVGDTGMALGVSQSLHFYSDFVGTW